jgi:hypothetical protein
VLKDGLELPLTEGIRDNVPDYFKPSSTKTGGSGSASSKARDQVTIKKADLDRLAETARKTGSQADLAAYNKAKREVRELEGAKS